MPPSFPIQGVTPDGGGVELRQEIDEWASKEKNAVQIALFFLALKKFMQLDPLGKDGKLSYYQIAGIHGMPAQQWDGAPPPGDPEPGTGQTGGYCTHNKSTFSTWHRPYLLLFEQRIWEIMKEIVSRFQADDNEMATWRNAADTWRLPYWDWSTEEVPEAVKTVEPRLVAMPVMRPEEVPGKFENPLHKFTNPSLKPMGDPSMEQFALQSHHDPDYGTYPWDRCISTSRWGIFTKEHDREERWIHGVVNDGKVDRAIQGHGWYDEKGRPSSHGTIKQVVHMLFSIEWSSWETFATARYDKELKKPRGMEFLSLEYIHNNVHNWAGGQEMDSAALGAGHMSDVDVSAFDPIFYLHHCNIDRLLAIWQTLNPTLWFNEQQDDEPPPSGPLWPFYQDEKRNPWTSDACRDVSKLHYSYGDIVKTEEGDKEPEGLGFLDKLRKSINEKYGYARKKVLDAPHGITGLGNDYIVNVVYDRFAYGGAPYTIYFFLGKPEEHGATCIGSVYNFSSSRRSQEGSCDNCQQQRANGVLSRALVPITIPILEHAQSNHWQDIKSLDRKAVRIHLKDFLEWRVVVGGRIVDAKKNPVPNLIVFAMCGQADHYHDETKLSRYYDYKPIVDATKGKPNGIDDVNQCPAATE